MHFPGVCVRGSRGQAERLPGHWGPREGRCHPEQLHFLSGTKQRLLQSPEQESLPCLSPGQLMMRQNTCVIWQGWGVTNWTLTVSWCQYNSVVNPCVLSCALQVNPPYYVKLVELVPHPETAAVVMDTTRTLMTKVKLIQVKDRKLFYI